MQAVNNMGWKLGREDLTKYRFSRRGAQAQYILLYSGWGGLKLVSVTSVVSTTVSVWVLSCAVWRETTVVDPLHSEEIHSTHKTHKTRTIS